MFSKNQAIKKSGDWRYRFTCCHTLVLCGGELSDTRPGRFIFWGTSLYTHQIWGWMGARASLHQETKRKIFFPCWGSNPFVQIVDCNCIDDLAISGIWSNWTPFRVIYAKSHTKQLKDWSIPFHFSLNCFHSSFQQDYEFLF